MVYHTDVTTADPADYIHPVETTFRSIFYTDETVVIGLSGTAAISSWEIIDHTGLTVATGGTIASGSNRTWSPPPLPSGWYRALFYRASPATNYGLNQGSTAFVITRRVTGMPARPPLVVTNSGQDGMEDASIMAFLLSGPVRQRANAADPTYGQTFIQAGIDVHTTYYAPYDTARSKPTLISIPDGTEPNADPAVNAANIAAIVNRYPAVSHWEGANEPNATPGAWFAPVTQRFYQNVKAARSSAQVCGPCPVSFNGASLPNLRDFLSAGGGQWLDVWSFHAYNTHNGDLKLARRSWDAFKALLTEFGQWGKPRMNTEAGSFLITEFGAGQVLRQAHRNMLDLLIHEQYGVPKEFWSYFYSQNRGFLGFPSWLESPPEAGATVALLMTHSQELLGTAYEARLDFGTVGNDYLIGSRYRRANGTGVVSVLSSGRGSTPVTLQLTGGSPAAVNVVTGWGRTSSATVTAGQVTVTAGPVPVYVELPTGVTADPVDVSTRLGTQRSFASASVSGATGTTFTDTFNRANGPLGNGWSSTSAPSVSISGGQAVQGSDGPSFVDAVATQNFGSADGVITVTPTAGATSTPSVILRYTDASNCLILRSNNLYRMQGGVMTAIGGISVPMSNPLTVVMRGSTVLGYSNGTQLWQATETFNQTATVHGFSTSGPPISKFTFVTGSSGSYRIGSPTSLIDGSWKNALYQNVENNGDSQSVWESDVTPSAGTPVDITLTFAAPTFIDRVAVHCPPPSLYDLTVIRDADLQIQVGGVWSTVATSFGYIPRVEAIHSTALIDGFVESWDADVHSFELGFTRSQVDAVRLRVRDVSAGGMPTVQALNAFGALDTNGQPIQVGLGTATPRVSIQNVSAYDSASSGAAPAPVVGNPYVVRTIT